MAARSLVGEEREREEGGKLEGCFRPRLVLGVYFSLLLGSLFVLGAGGGGGRGKGRENRFFAGRRCLRSLSSITSPGEERRRERRRCRPRPVQNEGKKKGKGKGERCAISARCRRSCPRFSLLQNHLVVDPEEEEERKEERGSRGLSRVPGGDEGRRVSARKPIDSQCTRSGRLIAVPARSFRCRKEKKKEKKARGRHGGPGVPITTASSSSIPSLRRGEKKGKENLVP